MITALADSVVSAINASGLLDSGVTAVRKVIPRVDLQATATLKVFVITPLIERVPQNRLQFKNTHTVQIGVLKLLPDHEPDSVDPMQDLVEGLLNLRFADVTDEGRQAGYLTSTAQLFDTDRLENANEYVGVVTVQFVEFQSP